MPKPLEYDMRFVLHPEQDAAYVHFDKAEANANRFQPSSTHGFPRVNAWWLAEAALLSYWAPPEAVRLFGEAGLTAEYLEANGTDCYLAWQTDFLIVAFRGTQPDEWKDVLADARAAQLPWDVGHAHAGFADALERIWPALSPRVASLSSGRSVWCCGHSLGAALATLAAYRFEKTSGVCTFGSPRVGNETLASAFNARLAGKALRYVNDQDIVTHVPPPFFPPWIYKHVDPRRFIAPDGSVSDGGPSVPHFFEDVFGRPQVLLDTVHGLINGSMRHGPVALLDHMPKAYAVCTWNDHEKHPAANP